MLATFSGTPGDDVIEISSPTGSFTIVTINGAGGPGGTTTDPTITINAGGGNDIFRVHSMRDLTTILARGEGGNDTLINPSLLDLDAVYDGQFTFDGGTGSDEIIADNGHDTTTAYQMNLTGDRIQKAQTPGGFTFTVLEYGNVESLQYWDSNGSNLIGFYQMHTFGDNVELEIHGNGGNDTFINTSDVTSTFGDWDESIGTGGAFIDGGTGTDALQLRNQDIDTNLYQFSSSSIHGFAVPGLSTGSLSYAACETIDFVGGTHHESVVVSSKPGSTALHVNSGDGNDNFTIGSNDFDGSGILLSNTTFIGGPGTDSFTVQDRFDIDAAGEEEHYAWNSATFAKGTAGFNYSEFESQSLAAANGIGPGPFISIPNVNLISVSSTITQTTVSGGDARGCIVNVGSGTLNNINGELSLNLGTGPLDRINIVNNLDTTHAQYRLTQGHLLVPKVINFTGAEAFTINAGSGNDSFFIDGLSSGTAANLLANAGDDFFTLGAGDVGGTVLGPATMNGGAGLNTATVDNTTDNSPATQTLNGATFIDGQSHTFNGLSRLIIRGGPGGSNLTVNATAFLTDIFGDSGNDTYTVGGGDLDANLLANSILTIDAQGGTDQIILNDLNDTSLDKFYRFQRLLLGVDQFLIDGLDDRFVDWRAIEGVTFEASNAQFTGSGSSACFIVVDDSNTPLTIHGNGGPDSIQVQDASFPVTIDTGPGDGDSIFLNADLDANPGVAILSQSDEVRDLHVFSGGMLRVGNGAVLTKTGTLGGNLTINGVLDLAGGALLSRASGTTLDFFQTRLSRGRNGGGWNGSGAGGAINSSAAASSPFNDGVGYGLGSQIAINSISGFSIAPDDVLVRHTLDGDADLNGAVNLADFNRLASSFGQSNKSWIDGDSNYDGTVNLADFNALASNFGVSASSPAPARLALIVSGPEASDPSTNSTQPD
jgi:hypothetical protein